jgi:hypothetical protein
VTGDDEMRRHPIGGDPAAYAKALGRIMEETPELNRWLMVAGLWPGPIVAVVILSLVGILGSGATLVGLCCTCAGLIFCTIVADRKARRLADLHYEALMAMPMERQDDTDE